MPNKTLSAWLVGLLRSLGLQVLIAALVIPLACVFIFIPLYIVQNNRFSAMTDMLILGVSMGSFLFIILGGSFGVGAWMVLGRKNRLDAAFTPLGLAGKMYLLNGRQYHGQIGGRQVDVYFYRGPALDVYVSANLKTRLGIGSKDSVGNFVAGLINRTPLPLADPDLARFNVFPLDETWGRAVVLDPTARAALLALLADESALEMRQVVIQPGAILLRRYRGAQTAITPENARQWVNQLLTLARAAENLPPPQQTIEPTPLEEKTRVNRNAFILPAIGITCGLLSMLSLCAFIPVIVLILTEAP